MDQDALNQLKSYPLLQVVDVPLSLLFASEYNPRRFKSDESKEALKTSLREDPDFMRARPIIVNMHEGREGIIIAGHKRFLTAAELEWPTVPVMFVDVPEGKEKAWNVKDNIHNGEWIPEKLKENMTELRDLGYDMGTLGFTGGEVVDVMGGLTLGSENHSTPPNTGTTPKKGPKMKIAEGAELECPNCHSKFTYGVKAEMTGTE